MTSHKDHWHLSYCSENWSFNSRIANAWYHLVDIAVLWLHCNGSITVRCLRELTWSDSLWFSGIWNGFGRGFRGYAWWWAHTSGQHASWRWFRICVGFLDCEHRKHLLDALCSPNLPGVGPQVGPVSLILSFHWAKTTQSISIGVWCPENGCTVIIECLTLLFVEIILRAALLTSKHNCTR